jgi:hypothetical protein
VTELRIVRIVRRAARIVWASPGSLLGLSAAALALLGGGALARVDHTLECHGGFARWLLDRRPFRARAMTLGHVILGRDAVSLAATREHERVHVRQYERWGPLFIPAYLGCALYLWLRGRHPYWDNPFEVEAYALDRQRDQHAPGND